MLGDSICQPLFFARLASSKSIIIAGAGGGFDVYAGLPLAFALQQLGKTVHLANLSFSNLADRSLERVTPHVVAVVPDSGGDNYYFPERTLARWLHGQQLPSTVYAFEKVGVRPMRAAWQALCNRVGADAIVLVDGGTDILMRGDEAGLGTPEEDMTSLAAVWRIDVPTKLVASLGFGIDAFHGVCHAQFLENVATLERDGGYLGAFSVPRATREGALYLDAVAHAQMVTQHRPSIVNGSIEAAVRGEFGDVHFTARTVGSELFINPLMSIYFTFDLEAVARRSLYLPLLEGTESTFEVSALIEDFRGGLPTRKRRPIPV